jgi:hypothetical protein
VIEGAGCDGLAVLPGAVACFAVCTKMGFSKTVLYMVMTHAKGVCVVDDKREGYCLERFESIGRWAISDPSQVCRWRMCPTVAVV